MNFSSDAMADFEGLLEVNRKICKQQMAEKASPTLPTHLCGIALSTSQFVQIPIRFSVFMKGKLNRTSSRGQ